MSGIGSGPSGPRRTSRASGPARWQVPEVDEPALALAREVRRATNGLLAVGAARWANVLGPLAAPLEDGDLRAVRAAANRVRAAFGVGESVADELAADDSRVLREATDALLRALDRHEARVRQAGRGSR